MKTHQKNTLDIILHAAKISFISVGIFSFFINLLMLTAPIYMLQVFDRVLSSQSQDTLIFLTVICVLALILYALLEGTRNRILVNTSGWLDKQLGPRALQLCPDSLLNGNNYGGQALKDVTFIRQFLTGQAILTIFDSPWVFVYLAVIWFIHPVLFVLATIGALLLFILAYCNDVFTRKPLTDANAANNLNQVKINNILQNTDAIQGMGMLPGIIKTWEQDNQAVIENQKQASKNAGIVSASAKFIRMSLQILILGIGAYLVILQQLSPGGMIAASIIMARALQPIEQAIATWKQIIMARNAYQRIRDYFDQQDQRNVSIELPTPVGMIQIESLQYQAPKSDKTIIDHIEAKIQPGRTVCIIGPSASGKSTLAKLIVGALKPNSGLVRLDGADVYQWDRTDFGKFVGYCPQEVELFPGTVAENIARMQDISETKVVKAAQLSGAHEMILRLPNGYETKISPFMKNLSGGQRQRIALARAFYGEPRVLILDEPDANLDQEGEQKLIEAIRFAKSQSITVILISHRQNIIQLADEIMVLQGGQITAYREKDQVLAALNQAKLRAPQSKGGK